MEIKCQKCQENGITLWVEGKENYELHMMNIHGAYKNGESIGEKYIDNYESIKAWMRPALLSYPDTQGSYGALYLRWLFHIGNYRYNSLTKHPISNNSWERTIEGLSSLDSIGRAKRDVQEQATINIQDGVGTDEDYELIKNNKARIRSAHLEEVMHNYHANKKRYG